MTQDAKSTHPCHRVARRHRVRQEGDFNQVRRAGGNNSAAYRKGDGQGEINIITISTRPDSDKNDDIQGFATS